MFGFKFLILPELSLHNDDFSGGVVAEGIRSKISIATAIKHNLKETSPWSFCFNFQKKKTRRQDKNRDKPKM